MESTNPNENEAEEMSSEATREEISSEGEQQTQTGEVQEAPSSSIEDQNQEVGDLFDTDDDDFIKSLEDEQKKAESNLADQQELPEDAADIEEDEPATEEASHLDENLSEEQAPSDEPASPTGIIHHEVDTPLSQIPVTVNVELARINCSLQDLMDLNEQSVLELQGMSGQTLDLMVGDRCIGKAELLKIGDKMGIRILQITQ